MYLGKRNVFFYLLLMIIAGAACKKSSNYTVDNEAGATVGVSVYRSYADYTGETNPLFTAYVQPGGKVSIPSNLLSGSNRYYVDWFTYDYTHTNWNGDISFSKDSTGNSIALTDPGATLLRNFCINGGGLYSSWKAIDAYTVDDTLHQRHSTWGQSGVDTFKNFTLGKDFKFVLSTKDSVGDSTGNIYQYTVSQQPDSIAFNATSAAKGSLSFYGNLSSSYATDTIYMQFLPDTTYYLFIKKF